MNQPTNYSEYRASAAHLISGAVAAIAETPATDLRTIRDDARIRAAAILHASAREE